MSQFDKRSAVHRAAGAVIDTLENRRLLSVTLADNGDSTSTLNVIGSNGSENIYLLDAPGSNDFAVINDKNRNNVAEPGEVTIFTEVNINVIHVEAKKGDDKVEYHGFEDYVGEDRSLEIDLGDGKDSFLFNTDADKLPTKFDGKEVSVEPTLPNGADITDGSDFNIDVRGRGGKDTVTIDLSRTSILSSEVTIQIDTSSDDDTVNLKLPDAKFEEFIGGRIERAAQGVDGGANLASVLAIDLELGGGNDTVNQHLNTLITSDSAVTINTLAQGGNDKYNDYENFAVENGSELTVNMDLGLGKDRYHSEFNFNSGLLVTVIGTAGADSTTNGQTINGSGLFVDSSSAARFIVHGSDGDDKLEVDDIEREEVEGGLPFIFSAISGLFDVKLYGGDGNDTAEIDLDPSSVVNVTESGIFRGIVSGDDGNDKLRIDIVAGGEGGISAPITNIPAPMFSQGQWDLSLLGGPGKDTLGAAFLDLGSPIATVGQAIAVGGVDYGPRGGILVDGGSGTDKYDTEGNGVFKLRSVEQLDESLEDPFVP